MPIMKTDLASSDRDFDSVDIAPQLNIMTSLSG